MYAVVAVGGKQYKVREGSVFRIESVKGDIGSEFSFDSVLMFSDGDKVRVGQPEVNGVNVRGRIISHGKGKKIIVFKYKRRKGYSRKYGHRQNYTVVKVDNIEVV